MSASRVRRHLLAVVCAGGLVVAAGCGGGPKAIPVSGTATLDGQPLEGFLISFNPDAAKGNSAQVQCAGRIGGDGRYSLTTDDGSKQKPGAPAGWYKVTISSPDDKSI